MIQVLAQFDPQTFTLSYLVWDEKTLDALIIDPVLDYDSASGKISCESLVKLETEAKEKSLNIQAILETHAHADHLSSSQYLKKTYPSAVLAISERIKTVQATFKPIFNLTELKTDGSQFDLLLKDNQVISFGSIKVKVLPTPGHTPACASFLIADNLFVGDSMFMPDYGTGRCDFPAGSAKDLYQSIQKVMYALPDTTKIFVGHDYQPGGRALAFQTTVKEAKEQNIQLKSSTSEKEFLEFRIQRDQQLSAPKLLLPSIQVNIDAGHLPEAETNGKSYLKIPLS